MPFRGQARGGPSNPLGSRSSDRKGQLGLYGIKPRWVQSPRWTQLRECAPTMRRFAKLLCTLVLSLHYPSFSCWDKFTCFAWCLAQKSSSLEPRTVRLILQDVHILGGSNATFVSIRNESAPAQLAQCRFPGLVISNAKILLYFSNKIHRSNFIHQQSETVMVWNNQTADCSLKKIKYSVILL